MLFSVLATVLASASAALAAPALEKREIPGINSPASGTVIMPGQAFDYSYQPSADYCDSTYNTTVFLLTSLPTSFAPSATWAEGHYFGRFDYENYPADPYPKNPAPAQLVMPDFSKAPGGFGAGATGSDIKMYFVVLEEYNTCSDVIGNQLALSMSEIIYNGTTAS